MAIDVIDDFLLRLTRHLPTAQPLASQLEAELRQHWGGTEPYIRHRPATAKRTQALAQALQQGQPLQQAFATAGLPRRTGFRHLGKRDRDPNRSR